MDVFTVASSTGFFGTFLLTSKSTQGQTLDWQARTYARLIQALYCWSLRKYSRAQKAGLKTPLNASPGRVMSPKVVMTERSEAKSLKAVEIMEQHSNVILQ